MNVVAAMRQVESHEFAARINVASDFKTFLRAAWSEEATQFLIESLDSADCQYRLLRRIAELSGASADIRYENPWDIAMAVYLWLLHHGKPILAQLAAENVSRAHRTWWAEKMARHVLLEAHVRSDSVTVYQVVTWSSQPIRRLFQVSDSGEFLFHLSMYSVTEEAPRIALDYTTRGAVHHDPVRPFLTPSQLSLPIGEDAIPKRLDFQTATQSPVTELAPAQ